MKIKFLRPINVGRTEFAPDEIFDTEELDETGGELLVTQGELNCLINSGCAVEVKPEPVAVSKPEAKAKPEK